MSILGRVVLCFFFCLLPFSRAQTLTVFAASSLTEAFSDVAAAFEQAHEGVVVALNFAGSATLATQLIQGAPADVFASANMLQMERVAAEGLLVAPARVFAANKLVVITPADSGIVSLKALQQPGLLLILAQESVPVGAYAREVLRKLDALQGDGFADAVLNNLVSEESNVRQVAAKVNLGEADAAIVYLTDVAPFEQLRLIEIPEAYNVTARYPLAALAGSKQSALAHAFIAFVLSAEGQAILGQHGFLPADAP